MSALALLAHGAGAVAAGESGSLTFATAEPLTLTWAQLLHGKSIEVCNGGAATVPRLQVVPEDFQFKRDGSAVGPSQVLTVKPPHHPIRPGECAPVHVALASEATIDPGEYGGSLLLVAAGHGGSVRLTTTVITASKKDPAPAGVAEPVALSIHNPSPWSRSAKATLLLKEPSSDEEALAIGKGCSASQPNEGDCPALGNLYQNSNLVRVSVDGPSRVNRDRGVQELPIALHGFQHSVGTYEGTLTLPGSTQAIKLKLTAKDAWWCAVIALLLGALLALVVQLWNGRWQPRGVLVERTEQLWERYGTRPVQGHELVEIDCGKLKEYLDDVKAAIALYAASVVMFDITSDAYKAIDDSLKLAEADAAAFAGPGGLKPELDQLEGEVKKTTAVLGRVQVSDVPKILRAASALLGGDKLGVGEANKRVKESEQLLPVLVAWRELASTFAWHVVWLKDLAERPSPNSRTRARELKRELKSAGVAMSGLRQRLFEVKDAGELATLRRSPMFWATLDQIALLGQTYRVSAPDLHALHAKDDGQVMGERGGDKLEHIGYMAARGDAFTYSQVIEKPAGVVIEPAKPAKLPERKRLRILGDGAVLGVSVVVSVVTGLSTFYFTQSFGTFTDYLTVIVIGAAAQTLLKGVLNQTSILLHDIAPSKPVVPAKVFAPAPAAVQS